MGKNAYRGACLDNVGEYGEILRRSVTSESAAGALRLHLKDHESRSSKAGLAMRRGDVPVAHKASRPVCTRLPEVHLHHNRVSRP